MKFNISYPFGGDQKKIEIDDEKKLQFSMVKELAMKLKVMNLVMLIKATFSKLQVEMIKMVSPWNKES